MFSKPNIKIRDIYKVYRDMNVSGATNKSQFLLNRLTSNLVRTFNESFAIVPALNILKLSFLFFF